MTARWHLKCSKKKIRAYKHSLLQHIELLAKLLDYFLWSNKSNLNQEYWQILLALVWIFLKAINCVRTPYIERTCVSTKRCSIKNVTNFVSMCVPTGNLEPLKMQFLLADINYRVDSGSHIWSFDSSLWTSCLKPVAHKTPTRIWIFAKLPFSEWICIEMAESEILQ